MVESLDESRTDECLGHDVRGKPACQFLRRNAEGIGGVDEDFALPVRENPGHLPVYQEGNGQEDGLCLESVRHGPSTDARAEFFDQDRERLGTTGVCEGDFDVSLCKSAGESLADLA